MIKQIMMLMVYGTMAVNLSAMSVDVPMRVNQEDCSIVARQLFVRLHEYYRRTWSSRSWSSILIAFRSFLHSRLCSARDIGDELLRYQCKGCGIHTITAEDVSNDKQWKLLAQEIFICQSVKLKDFQGTIGVDAELAWFFSKLFYWGVGFIRDQYNRIECAHRTKTPMTTAWTDVLLCMPAQPLEQSDQYDCAELYKVFQISGCLAEAFLSLRDMPLQVEAKL